VLAFFYRVVSVSVDTNQWRLTMENKTKRVAILVEQQYQVLEVWYPWLRLREAGCAVLFVGTRARAVYPSKEGYPVNADESITEVSADDFDAVVIPGGFAPDFMRREPAFARFVKALDERGRVVAAICHGGWMLVSAGILQGRRATSFFAIQDDLRAAGARWVDEEVAVDRNLITARKPDDLPAFTVEIINQLRRAGG
jgi:protease I